MLCKVSPLVYFQHPVLTVIYFRGIIVPGGFGLRGTEGMIAAIKWAREKKVPFLGICLGFQVACIEWARNVCGMEGELSGETDGSVD